jgi:hypothetical protein
MRKNLVPITGIVEKFFTNPDLSQFIDLLGILGCDIDGMLLQNIFNDFVKYLKTSTHGVMRGKGIIPESEIVIDPEDRKSFEGYPDGHPLKNLCSEPIKYINLVNALDALNTMNKKNKASTDADEFAFAELYNTLKGKYILQPIEVTSIYEIYAKYKNIHVHSGNGCNCSYHEESAVVHAILAFLIALILHLKDHPITHDQCYEENSDCQVMKSDYKKMMQVIITAFVHDIGKFATASYSNGQSAFHCHGESGATTLRRIYFGSNGNYDYFFTKKEWEIMCTVVHLHMEGCSMTPNELRQTLLGLRLRYNEDHDEVLEQLCCLARADKKGAIPNVYVENTIVADDPEAIELIKSMRTIEFLKFFQTFNVNRGCVVFMNGASASGKTTIVEEIMKVCPDVVLCNRDKVIEMFGGYSVVYNDKNKCEEVDKYMLNMISEAIKNNKIVIIDTCQIYYGTFFKHGNNYSYIKNALRIFINCDRMIPVTEEDSKRHHCGDFIKQLEIAGSTNLMIPYSIGKIPMTLRDHRTCGSSSDVGKKMNNINPHLVFANTVTDIEEVIKLLIEFLKTPIVESPTNKMTLHELIAHLFEKFKCVTNEEKLVCIENYFEPKNYNVNQIKNRDLFLTRIAVWKKGGDKHYSLRNVKEEDCSIALKMFEHLTLEQIQKLIKKLQKFNKNSVIIKYCDGMNHDFKYPWHFECRSCCVIFKDTDTDTDFGFDIIPVMHRGSEVLGKKTQDNSNYCYDEFSLELQAIMTRLNFSQMSQDKKEEEIEEMKKLCHMVHDDVIATGKSDGSCARFMMAKYGTSQFEYFLKLILYSNVPFEREFAEKSLEATKGEYIIIIATNGTLGVGSEDMQGYFVSSMVHSDVNKEHLMKMIEKGKTPCEVSQFVNDDGTTLFSRFISKIMETHETPQFGDDIEKQKQFESSNTFTYLYEMVLENRLNPFNQKIHDELAISYTEKGAGVMFLGRNYYNGNVLESNPFYMLKHNFSQPLYWKTTVEQLLVMSSDINKVVTGKMTEEEFMTEHPSTGGSGTFDPEGFVAYFTVTNSNGEIKRNIYTKVKTDAYYKFHKLRLEELSELLSYPQKVEEYFPALGSLMKFFDINRQMEFIKNLVKASISDEMKSMMPEKAKASFEKACCELEQLSKNYENSQDEKEKAKFQQLKQAKQKDVSKRILGQKDASETWNNIVVNMINYMFGKVNNDEIMNVGGYAKKLLMEDLKVFDKGYEELLISMLDCHQVEKNGNLPNSFGKIYFSISS